jgi:hypothetical protein
MNERTETRKPQGRKNTNENYDQNFANDNDTIRTRLEDDAVSEDRTHDLRIMRPTRYQLRYHRHVTKGAPARMPKFKKRDRPRKAVAEKSITLADRQRAPGRGRRERMDRATEGVGIPCGTDGGTAAAMRGPTRPKIKRQL